MKTFSCLVFLFVLHMHLHAQCAWYSVHIYPESGNIGKNPVILLEGLSAGMDVIYALNKNTSLYLKTGNEKIKLIVKEVCTGQVMVAQAVLMPEKTLTPGIEYTLTADSLPYNEQLHRLNKFDQKYGPIKYMVQESSTIDVPVLAKLPVKIKNYFFYTSCGQDEFVEFDYQLPAKQQYLFKATVTNINTGKAVNYYIPSELEKIRIGHSSCGGPFDWQHGGVYQLRLSFTDSAGILHALPNPVTFKSPV